MNHKGTKPLQDKNKLSQIPYCSGLAQRLRASVLAKLCTCEAVKDKRFLKFCGSRLLCVYNSWRGPRPTYRDRLFPVPQMNSHSLCPSFWPPSLCLTGRKSVLPSIFMAPRGPFLCGSSILDQPTLYFLTLFFAWRLPEENIALATTAGTAEQRR